VPGSCIDANCTLRTPSLHYGCQICDAKHFTAGPCGALDPDNKGFSWKEHMSASSHPLPLLTCAGEPLIRGLRTPNIICNPPRPASLEGSLNLFNSLSSQHVCSDYVLMQNWGKELLQWIGSNKIHPKLVIDTTSAAVQVSQDLVPC
jgi:hypothetical protein